MNTNNTISKPYCDMTEVERRGFIAASVAAARCALSDLCNTLSMDAVFQGKSQPDSLDLMHKSQQFICDNLQ